MYNKNSIYLYIAHYYKSAMNKFQLTNCQSQDLFPLLLRVWICPTQVVLALETCLLMGFLGLGPFFQDGDLSFLVFS